MDVMDTVYKNDGNAAAKCPWTVHGYRYLSQVLLAMPGDLRCPDAERSRYSEHICSACMISAPASRIQKTAKVVYMGWRDCLKHEISGHHLARLLFDSMIVLAFAKIWTSPSNMLSRQGIASKPLIYSSNQFPYPRTLPVKSCEPVRPDTQRLCMSLR